MTFFYINFLIWENFVLLIFFPCWLADMKAPIHCFYLKVFIIATMGNMYETWDLFCTFVKYLTRTVIYICNTWKKGLRTPWYNVTSCFCDRNYSNEDLVFYQIVWGSHGLQVPLLNVLRIGSLIPQPHQFSWGAPVLFAWL